MVGGDIGAPLKALTGVVTKVWYVFFFFFKKNMT